MYRKGNQVLCVFFSWNWPSYLSMAQNGRERERKREREGGGEGVGEGGHNGRGKDKL